MPCNFYNIFFSEPFAINVWREWWGLNVHSVWRVVTKTYVPVQIDVTHATMTQISCLMFLLYQDAREWIIFSNLLLSCDLFLINLLQVLNFHHYPLCAMTNNQYILEITFYINPYCEVLQPIVNFAQVVQMDIISWNAYNSHAHIKYFKILYNRNTMGSICIFITLNKWVFKSKILNSFTLLSISWRCHPLSGS